MFYQQVIGSFTLAMDKESGIRQFDGTNYVDWRYRMDFLLREKKLIYLVTEMPTLATRSQPDYEEKEIQCRGLIYKHVSPDISGIIRDLPTAYEMSLALTKQFEFKGMSTQSLIRKKLTDLKYHSNDNLQLFFNEFDKLIKEYCTAGGNIRTCEVVQQLLEAMPIEFESVVIAIQIQAGTNRVEVDTVKNMLMQFDARRKLKSNPAGPSSSSTTESAAFNVEKKKPKFNKKKIRCYNCNEYGHKSNVCPKPKKQKKTTSSWAILGSGEPPLHSAGGELVFVIDSGATEHIVADSKYLVDVKKLDKPFNIAVAIKGQQLQVFKSGKLEASTFVDGEEIQLSMSDACIADGLSHNLFSVRKIEMVGGSVTFKDGKAVIMIQNKVVAVGERIGYLYYLKLRPNLSTANIASTTTNTTVLWHRRLGHLHSQGVSQLINRGLAIGVNEKVTDNLPFCDHCILGKSTRLPFSSHRHPTRRPLERIHTDVAGPMPVESLEGHRYYVTFIDDYTHLTVTYLLKKKSEVFEKFKIYHKMVTAHFNLKIEKLRSDSGGEYISREFTEYLKSNGICAERNVAYNPELNGAAERLNRSLMDKARPMLI